MRALSAAATVLMLVIGIQLIPGTAAAEGQSILQAGQFTGDEEVECNITAPSPDAESGVVVLSTEPRWSGVRITVDGIEHLTDDTGCLVLTLPLGDHTFDVVSLDPEDRLQNLDGKVRSLRRDWVNPVVVGTEAIELRVTVDPPVCELLDPQPTPEELAAQEVDEENEEEETSRLVISTVPRTEGVLVHVDGEEVFTDEEGCLILELPEGLYDLEVPDLYEVDETTRFVFGRWDDIWDIERAVRVGPGDVDLDLGIKILHPVGFEFFDASLEPFAVADVQSATIVNSFGETFTLSEKALEEDESISFDSVWLPKNRLRRVSGGLQSDDNIYVLRDVFVDGANVVQSGEIDYIPALNTTCPDLADPLPQRCSEWRIRLLLFPFQVELRNFLFRHPVEAEVAIYHLNAPADGEALLSGPTNRDGVVVWSQVPRGDYEIRVTGGGLSTTTPTIVTGPKVEQITVMTSDVLWFAIPVAILMLFTIVLFIIRPRWRLGLVAIWPIVIGFVLSAPSLGAALNRPLSASVAVSYTADGAFSGIDAVVRNSAPISVDQTYCSPDFELRVPHSDGIWIATYESPDYHDVEMSRQCRLHRVKPGSSRELFVSTAGQEWSLDGELPPPGVYEAFVKVFDVPAGAVDVDFRNGLAPFLTFSRDEEPRNEEIPFTNPFED